MTYSLPFLLEDLREIHGLSRWIKYERSKSDGSMRRPMLAFGLAVCVAWLILGFVLLLTPAPVCDASHTDCRREVYMAALRSAIPSIREGLLIVAVACGGLALMGVPRRGLPLIVSLLGGALTLHAVGAYLLRAGDRTGTGSAHDQLSLALSATAGVLVLLSLASTMCLHIQDGRRS